MSAHAGPIDPSRAKLWDDSAHEHDFMATRLFGFWLYMLSDSLIFAALFAAYGVLGYNFSSAGGPNAHDVAAPIYAYGETIVLFTSAFAYGLAMVELKRGRPKELTIWVIVAFLLGAGFIAMQWHEMADLIARGITPQRSGYLSIFFTILAVHGIHLAIGLLWMVVMVFQVRKYGLTLLVTYRLANLKVFWLYQALIWTFVYTFVYLRGAMA